MKLNLFLFLTLFSLSIAKCTNHSDFTVDTGITYWESFKKICNEADEMTIGFHTRTLSHLNQLDFFADHFDDRQPQFSMDFLIDCPIQGFRGLLVSAQQDGILDYTTLKGFCESINEVFETQRTLVNNAKYIYKDLQKLQAFYIDALCYLDEVQFLINSQVIGITSDFDEELYRKNLKPFYTPAKEINSILDEHFKHASKRNSVMTPIVYINFCSRMSYLQLMNFLYVIEAHIDTHKNSDKKILNRNLKSSIQGINYSFDSSPKSVYIDHFGLDSKEAKSDKKTYRKPKKNQSKPKSIKKKTSKNTKVNEPLNPAHPTEVIQTRAFLETAINEEIKTPIQEKPVNESQVEPSDKKEPHPENKKPKRKNPQVEVSQKYLELENILSQFDNGPKKGMKTRRFLRLCVALNKTGLFAEFKATNKEVMIKTVSTEQSPGMKASMHTNHSGKKKNPGITRPTAEKLQSIINHLLDQQRKSKE